MGGKEETGVGITTPGEQTQTCAVWDHPDRRPLSRWLGDEAPWPMAFSLWRESLHLKSVTHFEPEHHESQLLGAKPRCTKVFLLKEKVSQIFPQFEKS